MFRNVVAALNEAQDITLFLGPLAKHFEVSVKTEYIHTLLAVIAFRDIIYMHRKTNIEIS